MIETYNHKVNFFNFESLNQLTDSTEEDMTMFRWRSTIVSMGHNIRKYQKLKKRIKEIEEKQMKQVKEMFRLFICCKSQYKNVGLRQYKNVGFTTFLYCLFSLHLL